MSIEVSGVNVRLIESEFSSVSAQHLRDADTSYCGAQLMIYRMPVVRYFCTRISNCDFSQTGIPHKHAFGHIDDPLTLASLH